MSDLSEGIVKRIATSTHLNKCAILFTCIQYTGSEFSSRHQGPNRKIWRPPYLIPQVPSFWYRHDLAAITGSAAAGFFSTRPEEELALALAAGFFMFSFFTFFSAFSLAFGKVFGFGSSFGLATQQRWPWSPQLWLWAVSLPLISAHCPNHRTGWRWQAKAFFSGKRIWAKLLNASSNKRSYTLTFRSFRFDLFNPSLLTMF